MDRRRTPGLSSLSTNRLQTHHYTAHGARLAATQSSSLQAQLSVFQSLLHNFALTHSKDIRANPEFRAEFARMCSAIGVDFLASSNKPSNNDGGGGGGGVMGNLWAQMLGSSVNDFYFELAVRVVEVCRETRSENGGLISVSEMQTRIQRSHLTSTSTSSITADDIVRAVDSLTPLGSCFTIMKLGHNQLIRSVPKDLNTDQSTVLEAIQVLGYVTVSMLQVNLGWERARSVASVEDLMADSLVWVDCQAGENEYWSPAFISGASGG